MSIRGAHGVDDVGGNKLGDIQSCRTMRTGAEFSFRRNPTESCAARNETFDTRFEGFSVSRQKLAKPIPHLLENLIVLWS